MDETLVGRAWEHRELEKIRQSNTPELVAIYGTRENAYYDQLVDGQVTSDQLFNV